MNLQARKVILVSILIIFSVVILLFIQLMRFAEYSEGQPPPLSFTSAYIETQTATAQAPIGTLKPIPSSTEFLFPTQAVEIFLRQTSTAMVQASTETLTPAQ